MYGLGYPVNLSNIKNFNRHAILDLIRFTPGGISRAELARQMDLSRSAVTAIINDLIAAGIVHETEVAVTGGGRRPMLLEVNPGRGNTLGIDMGSTHLSMLISDLAGHVLHERDVPFDVTCGPEAGLQALETHVQAFLQQSGASMEEVLAVGLGVPGPVVSDGGGVIAPPIMPGWDNYPIRAHLQERWQRPVSLNNDAELGALGEWAYGAGRGEANLVYIKVGSGIGAGLILNNAIYRGVSGTAGEIGHVTIQDKGPLCTCGNLGCLEAVAGGRAIAMQARQAVLAGQRTQLAAVKPLERLTAYDVTLAARKGDLVAQHILSEAGWSLGTAIAGLINLINPGIVVVGGGVAQAGDLFLEPVRQASRERSLKAAAQSVRIIAAVLGRRSSSMGAVVQAHSLALHELTEHPSSPRLVDSG